MSKSKKKSKTHKVVPVPVAKSSTSSDSEDSSSQKSSTTSSVPSEDKHAVPSDFYFSTEAALERSLKGGIIPPNISKNSKKSDKKAAKNKESVKDSDASSENDDIVFKRKIKDSSKVSGKRESHEDDKPQKKKVKSFPPITQPESDNESSDSSSVTSSDEEPSKSENGLNEAHDDSSMILADKSTADTHSNSETHPSISEYTAKIQKLIIEGKKNQGFDTFVQVFLPNRVLGAQIHSPDYMSGVIKSSEKPPETASSVSTAVKEQFNLEKTRMMKKRGFGADGGIDHMLDTAIDPTDCYGTKKASSDHALILMEKDTKKKAWKWRRCEICKKDKYPAYNGTTPFGCKECDIFFHPKCYDENHKKVNNGSSRGLKIEKV